MMFLFLFVRRLSFSPLTLHLEHIISSIASLFRHLTNVHKERLIAKFREKEFEKIDRLLELREQYEDAVSAAAAQATAEEEEELDKEELYLKRLEGGLFKLQMIDFVIGELTCTDDEAMRTRLFRTLARKDIALETIEKNLNEYAANIGSSDAADEKAAKERARVSVLVAALEKQRAATTTAAAAKE